MPFLTWHGKNLFTQLGWKTKYRNAILGWFYK